MYVRETGRIEAPEIFHVYDSKAIWADSFVCNVESVTFKQYEMSRIQPTGQWYVLVG